MLSDAVRICAARIWLGFCFSVEREKQTRSALPSAWLEGPCVQKEAASLVRMSVTPCVPVFLPFPFFQDAVPPCLVRDKALNPYIIVIIAVCLSKHTFFFSPYYQTLLYRFATPASVLPSSLLPFDPSCPFFFTTTSIQPVYQHTYRSYRRQPAHLIHTRGAPDLHTSPRLRTQNHDQVQLFTYTHTHIAICQ